MLNEAVSLGPAVMVCKVALAVALIINNLDSNAAAACASGRSD